jgi:hypothetical protein
MACSSNLSHLTTTSKRLSLLLGAEMTSLVISQHTQPYNPLLPNIMSKNSYIQITDSETANTIAIAAVGISIAAFLVAYLQLLLGSSLTSSALWKTNRAALGSLVHQRSWRLTMKRVKVTYPEISFNLGDLGLWCDSQTGLGWNGPRMRLLMVKHQIMSGTHVPKGTVYTFD